MTKRTPRRGRRAQCGLSLAELLATVSVLGVAAAVAVPVLTVPSDAEIVRVESEIAYAMTYARTLSRTSNFRHGVTIDDNDQMVRVFRLDDSNQARFDVLNPITRRPYTLDYGGDPDAPLARMTVTLNWRDACTQRGVVVFDATGFIRCLEPATTQLDSGRIDFGREPVFRSVSFDGETGRIARNEGTVSPPPPPPSTLPLVPPSSDIL